ncbi:CYCA2 protein, partial [Haematococcus lacustris]
MTAALPATLAGLRHPAVKPTSRAILVDWLVDVTSEFGISQAALFQAVSMLDRCLAVKAVRCSQLQLLGATCLWLACKLEDVQLPSLSSMVRVTDYSVTPEQMLACELEVLVLLEYDLVRPNAA